MRMGVWRWGCGMEAWGRDYWNGGTGIRGCEFWWLAGEACRQGEKKQRQQHGEGDQAQGQRSNTAMLDLVVRNTNLVWGWWCRQASMGMQEPVGRGSGRQKGKFLGQSGYWGF